MTTHHRRPFAEVALRSERAAGQWGKRNACREVETRERLSTHTSISVALRNIPLNSVCGRIIIAVARNLGVDNNCTLAHSLLLPPPPPPSFRIPLKPLSARNEALYASRARSQTLGRSGVGQRPADHLHPALGRAWRLGAMFGRTAAYSRLPTGFSDGARKAQARSRGSR